MKSTIYDIFFILVICLFIGIARSLIIQDIDLIKVSSELSEEVPDAFTEPVFISIELAKILFDQEALFIDARDLEKYLEGHIENSINIPWENTNNSKIDDQFLDISYDQDIVIYCSGGDCTLSIDLGEYIFNELSYERVFIFEGGYPSWIENNFPISKGRK
tara:strand:- start:603 stop:1085 length:483 start_codon:yes stop_codon:yes gene_type:complete